jgi:hypothetical protein
MSIPVVIFHKGDQQYFQKSVLITAKTNIVYVIGDDSNKDIFKEYSNIRFFHINNLESNEIVFFKSHFINYSTNNFEYELNCFLRVFYIKNLLLLEKLSSIFHIDSDVILLNNINSIFSLADQNKIYYPLQIHEQTNNKYHMVGSIHSALLNLQFCNKFIELCSNIYI